MKNWMHSALLGVLLLGAEHVRGQNLVPNGSFEDLTGCPENPGEISQANAWSSFRGTPDLYNDCNLNGYFDIPGSANAYQWPSQGLGYIGVLTYATPNPQANVREFAGAALATPLVPGTEYSVSMKVAVGGFGWYPVLPGLSANNIGMFFSTVPLYGTTGQMPNWSAVHAAFPLQDTVSWTVLSGTFMADSAYAYIVLGNPYSDSLTSFVVIDSSATYSGAYGLIDEVCVSPLGGLCGFAESIGSENPEATRAWIYPNPFQSSFTIHMKHVSVNTEVWSVEVLSPTGTRIDASIDFEADDKIRVNIIDRYAGPVSIRLNSASGKTLLSKAIGAP